MKVKVIKDSVIYRGVIRKIGFSFDCEPTIAESLINRGYVEAVDGTIIDVPAEDITPVDDAPEMLKGHLDPEHLKNDFTYQELKKLASDLGVSANGTKEELIARIVEVEVECPATEDEAESEDEADSENEEGPATDMPEM